MEARARWGVGPLHALLTNPIYKGQMRFNRTGTILLTGLAVCGSCHGGMTLRTGTSKSGRVYRYYTCASCARSGSTACKGRSIRMDKLDSLVTNRLLAPERLSG
jgi:hypothetical protein